MPEPSPPATIQADRSPDDKKKLKDFVRSARHRQYLRGVRAIADQRRKKRG